MMPSASHSGADALPRELFALLGREHTLPLLEATMQRPRSVGELVTALDVPRGVVHRRVWALEERDLVRTRGAVDDGERRLVVASNLRRLALAGDAEGYALVVTYARAADPDPDAPPTDVWARAWRAMGDGPRD